MVGMQGGPGSSDPTRVRFSRMGLKNLVSKAWDLSGLRIAGPSWTEENRFDIVATMAEGTTKEQFRAMLQNLLVDRFHLETHREVRVVSLYALAVGKAGAKLKPPQANPPQDPGSDAKPPQGMKKDKDGYPAFAPGMTIMGIYDNNGKPRAGLQAHDQPIEWLIQMLSGQLGATVTDETGLTGKYDYAMSWVPESPGAIPAENQDLGGPSLMNAVQEQLGLKLTAKKGPIEFIVIDRAERKPIEN